MGGERRKSLIVLLSRARQRLLDRGVNLENLLMSRWAVRSPRSGSARRARSGTRRLISQFRGESLVWRDSAPSPTRELQYRSCGLLEKLVRRTSAAVRCFDWALLGFSGRSPSRRRNEIGFVPALGWSRLALARRTCAKGAESAPAASHRVQTFRRSINLRPLSLVADVRAADCCLCRRVTPVAAI